MSNEILDVMKTPIAPHRGVGTAQERAYDRLTKERNDTQKQLEFRVCNLEAPKLR